MKPLKTKAETRPAEPEQESYPVCSKNQTGKTGWQALIAAFLDYQQGIGRAEDTLSHHRCSLKLWLRFLDERGIDDLAAVTPQVAAAYQTWLYQAKSRFKRPYTLQSQIGILNSLQVFFKFLLKTGRILSNPAETIQLPREPKKLPGTILSSQEMKRLLNQPDTATVLGFRDRAICEVLYSTGLRVSELTGMRVQDLDLSARTIFVPKSKHFNQRYVPLGDAACRYLAEYLERIRPLLLRNGQTDVIFLSRIGRPLHKTSVFNKLKVYGRRAGIKKRLTVHVFRHTLATEMLKRGADLRQIQELLGHRQLRTTQVYTHVVKGELKRIQAHCHPREQVDLPDNFVRYRGRKHLQEGDE